MRWRRTIAEWREPDRRSEPPTGPEPLSTTAYILGLDLGQAQDPSALAIAERFQPTRGEATYAFRHLHRWPLGTPYTAIVADVAALVTTPPLNFPVLTVDRTGVGRAVFELFEEARLAANLQAILITAGNAVTREPGGCWHVAKVELVSVLQALLQSGRLKIAAELPLAESLKRELLTFKAKITVAGNETFEAWRERDHDDLVLAVALSCWFGERLPVTQDVARGFTPRPRQWGRSPSESWKHWADRL
jgi:hypothetical protein